MVYRRSSNSILSSIPPAIRVILLINLAVFLLLNLSGYILGEGAPDFFAGWLAIRSYDVINKFYIWQIATYMFAHQDFWHIFLNLFGIFIFGRELEERWGTKLFVKFYLFCGVGAGLFILLIDLLSVSGGYTLGASGALFGLMVAYALYFPDTEMFIFPLPVPVKVKYLVLAYILYTLYNLIFGSGGNISHSGHMGGIIAAWLYFRIYQKNFLYRPANNTLDHFFKRFKDLLLPKQGSPKPKGQVYKMPVLKNRLDEKLMSDSEIEECIDELLEKISRGGLKSLSTEEQLFLDRIAAKFRHKFPD